MADVSFGRVLNDNVKLTSDEWQKRSEAAKKGAATKREKYSNWPARAGEKAIPKEV